VGERPVIFDGIFTAHKNKNGIPLF